MSNGNQQPALRLNVLVVFFAYGGNGGVAMQLPAIGQWWARTLQKASSDPRISDIQCITLADTPITMTRNRAVRLARENGFHVLVMVDSDNEPDIYEGGEHKPFWDSSFDFVYQRALIGLPTVVAAPYCGPPPHPTRGGEENVYVFRWTNNESVNDDLESCYKLEGYTRAEASLMAGIHPAGALPTGLLMATVNAFDLCCPDGKPVAHFYYEWSDDWQTDKGSTEDVTATRDISLAGHSLLGEEVVFCNWDAWAGHHKPKCVGKPIVPSSLHVNKVLTKSVTFGVDPESRKRYLTRNFPRFAACLSPEEAERVVADNKKRRASGGFPVESGSCADDLAEAVRGLKTNEIILPSGRKLVVGWQAGKADAEALNALTEIASEVASKHPDRPLRVLDIGSFACETAVAIAEGFGSVGGHIYCCEVFDRDRAWENAGDLEGDVIRHVSRDLQTFDPTGADIVVVSGMNERLITEALRHVSDDGVLCGFLSDPPEWATAKRGIWTAIPSQTNA